MTELVKSMVAYGGAWGDPMPDAEDDDGESGQSVAEIAAYERYREALRYLESTMVRYPDAFEKLEDARAEADSLRKTAKSLLGALKAVEWVVDIWGSSVECPWCKIVYFAKSPWDSRKHRSDCGREIAIADAASNPHMQGEE